jgi:surface antigen Omp85-like protein
VTLARLSALVLFVAVAAPAHAQQTRAETLERQRADKAGQLRGYERGRFEAFLFELEDRRLPERIFNPPRGIFVRMFGLPEGAGFGAGPAARFSNDTLSVTATSAITARRYWELDGRVAFPRLAGGNGFAEAGARRRDFPQEDFYGLGPGSERAMRTSYALRETSIDGSAGFRPASWLTITGNVEYLTPRIGHGEDPRVPSIEALFAEPSAPGLAAQPDFLRVGGTIRAEHIDAPFGSGMGGRYIVSYNRFQDRDERRYSFGRWDVELQQYVPIVNNARYLALRARFSELTPDGGHEVPFYLQPTLGGGYTLRGLDAYRFRDRALMLLQAEYRWQAGAFVTGAIFYDAGTVAPTRRDLDLRALEHDYGIGLRLGFLAASSMRADLAFGSGEGTRIVLKFSNVF